MQNEIYSCLVQRAVPEDQPSYYTQFAVTKEVNGFALWRVIYIDGEAGEGDEPFRWFAGTDVSTRYEAIEAAVALVFEERKNERRKV